MLVCVMFIFDYADKDDVFFDQSKGFSTHED